MSTITAIGQPAMDGRIILSSGSIQKAQQQNPTPQQKMESLPEDVKTIKANVEQLQKISDAIGRKLRFNVNEELDKVIVKVVDPSTDKVIKEIPSAEIQKLQLHIKEAIGLLIDEKI